MRRLTRIPWVTVLLLVGVGSAAAVAAVGGGYEWSDPAPPITSIQDLSAKAVVSDVGLTLSAPGSQLVPTVSAEEAVKNAWTEEGAPGNPKGVHATFALLDWGTAQKGTPVWVVTYEGADCMLAAGAPGESQECVQQSLHTLIDARTGEYIASFTSPDSEGL
jgi:hypothetical protein